MRMIIAVFLAGATVASVASAQDNKFQGIVGELPPVAQDGQEAGTRTDGLEFKLNRDRNRELEKATGVIPAAQSQFYRPSILNARRARRTDGTGLTLIDKILSFD